MDGLAPQAAPRPGAPPYLQVRGLHKRFGDTPVLRDVGFEVAEGEFVCFLGPSGCGKTTLLMCLAGLEQADAGQILKRGEPIERLPPSRRDVGIVFQSYALFPNLTVHDNVAFGLASRHRPAAEIARTVAELLALLSLQGHERKYPSQLSGGQQQRVALARSLAVSPSLLLLDEPLSALDAQVRARLRGELRELQTRLGLTTIMVTHDQEEAQSLSDRIVLMNAGRIEQVGTPRALYDAPANAFVAEFIGAGNLHDGVAAPEGVRLGAHLLRCATRSADGAAVRVLVRPEDVRATPAPDDHAHAPARVGQLEHLGAVVRAHLHTDEGVRWIADLPRRAATLRPGERCWIAVRPADVTVFG